MTVLPVPNGSVTSPRGFVTGTAVARIKYANRKDTAVLYSPTPCTTAGLFTQNQVVAAPVIVCKETLATNATGIHAIVANAGIANACTGAPGLANARQTQKIAAQALGIPANGVLVMSTGVIGMQLPMDRLASGIQTACQQLDEANGIEAAQAIMTTDTHPKHTAVSVSLPEGTVTIGGMAKGAGMIHPNMATMLAVVTTDAAVPAALLHEMLVTAVNSSFNRISVDGDTSTNDTILLLANGAAHIAITPANQSTFQEGLTQLCTTLAQMIVRDGEGATKFVEIEVTGTEDDTAAHAIANTIATSPLVKTAFAGSDANWGRILAAAGRAGVAFNQDVVNLWIGAGTAVTLQLVANGTPTHYAEADAATIFAEHDIKVKLNVGAGNGRAIVWTSDLTHEYVTINADYRT
ncbi:MAG: bifunctional glutamate N-acetyltransferase/amino-acid acetyltransferase ArgJ [Candidatus Promineifilaceae bacterium]